MARKKISYTEARESISAIIQKIENEELDVDELSEQLRKASGLIKICEDKLSHAESEVDKILKNMGE